MKHHGANTALMKYRIVTSINHTAVTSLRLANPSRCCQRWRRGLGSVIKHAARANKPCQLQEVGVTADRQVPLRNTMATCSAELTYIM